MSCAKVHVLLQSHSVDNRDGTFFSQFHPGVDVCLYVFNGSVCVYIYMKQSEKFVEYSRM